METNVDPNDLKDVTCECGSIYWDQTAIAKIVPAVLSKTGQPTISMMPILVCKACGIGIDVALGREENV